MVTSSLAEMGGTIKRKDHTPIANKKVFLIGHQSSGNEGIESGKHLRWGFKQKMGFPGGGFRLYRRSWQLKSTFGFYAENFKENDFFGEDEYVETDSVYRKELPTGALCGPDEEVIMTITAASNQAFLWSVALQELKVGQERYFLIYGGDDETCYLNILFSHWVHSVNVTGFLKGGGKLEIRAYDENGPVDFKAFEPPDDSEYSAPPSVQTVSLGRETNEGVPHIKWLQIQGNSKAGIENILCRPYDNKTWQQIYPKRGSLFLPTGWGEANIRLPEDLAQELRTQYQNGFKESAEILNVLRDESQKLPMAERLLTKAAKAQDIPPPETREPTIRLPALGLALMAALDPNIARMLGLYFVDKGMQSLNYEYMIIGDWPEGTLWHLERSVDFDEYYVGKKFYEHATFPGEEAEQHITFTGQFSSQVVELENESQLGMFTRALRVTPHEATDGQYFQFRICFEKPVGAVQLFIQQPEQSPSLAPRRRRLITPTTLKAYKDGDVVHEVSSQEHEAIMAVSAPSIDYVELTGRHVYVLKVCYDEEHIPFGEHSSDIISVIKNPRPQPPRSIKATFLPGVTKKRYDKGQELLQGSYADARRCVGIRWQLPGTSETEPNAFISPSDPIRYLIEKSMSRGGRWSRLTQNPLVVVPYDPEDEPKPFAGWPQDRQFYVDDIEIKKQRPAVYTYFYRVAGIDIWGRQSTFSSTATAKIDKLPPPPPPVNIQAKFLDPADPWLMETKDIVSPDGTFTEKEWVKQNGPSIKISWQWTERLRRQAPDAKTFHIYLQPGWLNLIQGTVTDIMDNGDGTSTITTDHTVTSPLHSVFLNNLYKDIGEVVQIEGTPFNIIESTLGKQPVRSARARQPRIREYYSIGKSRSARSGPQAFTMKHTLIKRKIGRQSIRVPFGTLPKFPQGHSIYNLILKVKHPEFSDDRPQKGEFALPISPSNPLCKDFHTSSHWTISLHEEPITSPAQKNYQVVIKDPPLIPIQEDPILYGQIGISTTNEYEEGPVSSPVTVVTVYRTSPPKPECPEAKNIYASLPDFYGKSSFPVRWPRREGMSYEVYRAMDNTLFKVDEQNRANRPSDPDNTIYSAFFDDFSSQYPDDQYPGLVANIRQLIQVSPVDYGSLDNYLLQALASLPGSPEVPGNEKAFTKIHDHAIKADDPRYRDPEDPGMMCYVDGTLDGKARNRYFYRVRAVDNVGNRSTYSFSTPPIYLPETTPPRTPVVTKVTSGDRQITLQWAKNREDNLTGYHIYRTQNKERAQDVRMMDKIAEIPAGAPDSPISHIDNGLWGNQIYYYRIVAVSEGQIDTDVTQQICSSPSKIITSRTFDLSVPSPPVSFAFHPKESEAGDYSVRIDWTVSEPNIRCLLKRREQDSDYWITLTNWLGPLSFIEEDNVWLYRFIDHPPDKEVTYYYRLKLMNSAGGILGDEEEHQLIID